MATINFDINDALKDYMSDPASIATPEADSALFDCENDPESLTNQVLNPVLNPIVDAIADSPDAIMRASNMDSLQFLLKLAPICLEHALPNFLESSPSLPPIPHRHRQPAQRLKLTSTLPDTPLSSPHMPSARSLTW